MKQKLLCLLAGLAFLLPARLSAFEYTYEGVTLKYDVIYNEAKICKVSGYKDFSGALVIPDVANDGTTDYSVTEIGKEAFCDCSGLTSVVIPNSVTKIGNNAFTGCSLKSVIIPPSVTLMGSNVFYRCKNLKKGAVPYNLRNDKPFEGINVNSVITYKPEETIIEDGWIWGQEKSKIYFVPLDLEGDYSIPESVQTIGEEAFYGCSGLTSVVISNSVKEISWGAFYGCSGLTSVVIPESVKEIRGEAFKDCSGLTSVVIGNSVQTIGEKAFYSCIGLTSVVIPESVTSIGKSAFSSSGLTSVVIPNSVTEIGDGAFYDCSGMIKSAYPSNLKKPFFTGVAIAYNPEEDIVEDGWIWGPNKSAIYFAPLNLEGECSIPESVTSIGENAFLGCSGMTSVVIGNSVQTIGENAFLGCNGMTSVVIGNSVQTIGENAFLGCNGMTSVVIGNSVQTIGAYAFNDCSGMTSLVIPESVTYIGDSAFWNSGLISLTWNAEICTSCGTEYIVFPNTIENLVIGDKVKTIPANAFYKLEKLTSVVIPNSVTSIGNQAFYGCRGLTSVTALCVSPADMNDNAFKGLYDTVKLTVPDVAVNNYLATSWSLFKNIQNNSGMELGYFSDGVLEYRLNPTDMTATVIGAKDYSNLQIPERFTDDSDAANPVRYYINGIGYKAFDGKDVNSVEFNSRSQMEYIGDFAFANTSISSITLPETLKTICNYAFAQTNISSISIPESVSAIGDYAFYNTKKLSKIELKEGLESIGSYAFSAEKVRSVTGKPLYLPSTVKSVGMDAFRNFVCSQVDISDLSAWYSIDFGSKGANPLYRSDNGLYVNGEKLTSLKVPEDIKEIKPFAFYNCRSLKEVTFPEGLEKIGTSSFEDCYNVTEVTIPASVVEIGSNVFGQRKVTFADGLLPISLGESAFSYVIDLYCGRPLDSLNFGIPGVESLWISNLITEIPDSKFKDLKYLKTLSLGSSIQTIGDEAFSGCTALKEVILPPSVETIGASVFAGNSKLESIIMGHKVKTIGEKAFDGCKANTVSITAQTPPTAPNNTFSNYTGKLYLQGEKAKDAYYDAFTCWDRFDSYVMIDAEEIKIEGADKISGKAGDTFQLTATVWPENVTLPQIFWRSTNPEIATVDGNGLVTLHVDLESLKTRAGGEGDIDGVCTIIAETLYNDGPIAQVGVTAEDTPILVESLTIDPTAWSGVEGGEFTIKATVLPENADDKTLTFESSDTSVATVDVEGNVKVLKEGSCVITVSTVDGSDLKAECVVTGLSGVDAIFADPNVQVNVYDLNGVMLKKGCSREELKQLKPAVYILRSGDTVVKVIKD